MCEDIREKPFDEAICEFKALLQMIAHNPNMSRQRGALAALVAGDELLRNV